MDATAVREAVVDELVGLIQVAVVKNHEQLGLLGLQEPNQPVLFRAKGVIDRCLIEVSDKLEVNCGCERLLAMFIVDH